MVVCFFCGAISCKDKKAATSADERRATNESIPNQVTSTTTQQTTAISTQANQPLGTVSDCDTVCQQAKSVESTDIRKSMELLEAAMAKAPDDPHSAPYYLQLGRLKKEYENYQGLYPGTQESSEKQKKEFVEYAKARPKEYSYDEIGADYLYFGTHFKELEKRFPTSPFAIEAAYEITNLNQGGECEGYVTCYIEGAFAPVRDFLLRHPDTIHTAEAAQRADDSFRKNLWSSRQWQDALGEIGDPNKATDYYDPNELRKLVAEYEELAQKLPTKYRPRIWETAAHYRTRLGEKDKSRALYGRILKEFPS